MIVVGDCAGWVNEHVLLQLAKGRRGNEQIYIPQSVNFKAANQCTSCRRLAGSSEVEVQSVGRLGVEDTAERILRGFCKDHTQCRR